ncbi:MAG: DUF1501 domain-containing protein [Vicinamibacterales bacterium]
MALVGLGFVPSFLSRTVQATTGTRRSRRLIAIFQRGAVDGLSMVVPHGDADYYRARPTIALAAPGRAGDPAIDLDGFFGFHPRLAALAPIWRRGDLAIVHACGSPDATRSHFDAQDYMETGTPGVKSTRDGWLNRYLQVRERDDAGPFRAVSLTAQMPRTLQGSASALAMNELGRFALRAPRMEELLEAQYAAAADALLHGTGREAFDAMKQLRRADPAQYRPEHGAEYPGTAFGQALRQIAQLCKADVGLEVAFAELGGWDTHVNQGAAQGQLAVRLDDLTRSIAALVTDLGEQMADTVVLTMSEFGRAVGENGSRGTDHGHGNAMMVIGGGVRGGRVYGRWPGLAVDRRHEGRDLAITTDFRDVFGEIVVRHLGVRDAGPIFPGYGLDARRFPGLFA